MLAKLPRESLAPSAAMAGLFALVALVVTCPGAVSATAYADDLHKVELTGGGCAALSHTLAPNTNYQIYIEQLAAGLCPQHLITCDGQPLAGPAGSNATMSSFALPSTPECGQSLNRNMRSCIS